MKIITIAERLQGAGMEERVAKEMALTLGEVAVKEDLIALKKELKEYVDLRFEVVNQRFDNMDRSFNFLKWLIVISTGTIGILMTALGIILSL